jgi:peptidylprolyl isomerase
MFIKRINKIMNPIKSASIFTKAVLSFLIIVLNSPMAHAENQWRSLDVNNTVLMTLPHGQVVIELAPQFAPKHVAQFTQLANQGFYNNNKFYRVIDGFVAQAGPSDSVPDAPPIKIEGEWSTNKDWQFTKVQDNDLFAEQTGFIDGFAVGHNPSENKAWLTHCPGILAMARGNSAHSASSHFYFTIGQAPRYLDRIMTIFGRVVYGMEHIQAIHRTQVIEGDTPVKSADFTRIVSMKLMNNIPTAKRLNIEVEVTDNSEFSTKITNRKHRKSAFFYKKPPPVLDICQMGVKSRLVKNH